MVNTRNDYCRRVKHREETIGTRDYVDQSKRPLDQMIQKKFAHRVRDAIDTLPAIQKDAIILFYYHDMEIKDIAKITNVKVSTVKSRLK